MTGTRRVPVIGLAGGIGAGKSAAAAVLARAGCVVSDSDRDAAKVLADPRVVEAFRSALPQLTEIWEELAEEAPPRSATNPR